MSKLRRFAELSAKDKAIFLEAVAGLALASALLRTVGFGKLSKRLGSHMAQSAPTEAASVEEAAARVCWAVDVAARHLPWHPVCFPRAVAATMMLRRRGVRSTLYFGVDAARGLDAHAWVRVGRLIVSGGPVERRFTTVSTFA